VTLSKMRPLALRQVGRAQGSDIRSCQVRGSFCECAAAGIRVGGRPARVHGSRRGGGARSRLHGEADAPPPRLPFGRRVWGRGCNEVIWPLSAAANSCWLACTRASTKAANRSASLSPAARAFNIRRPLRPSRSLKKPLILIRLASSKSPFGSGPDCVAVCILLACVSAFAIPAGTLPARSSK
jgi:hypothetical protein